MRSIKFRAWNGREMYDPIDRIKDTIRQSFLNLYRGENHIYCEDYAFDLGDNIIADIDAIFHGEYKKYESALTDYGEMKQRWVKYQSSIVLMQFTGLQDKNGKEIYEGDIVKHHNGIKVVEYHEESVSFQMDLYDHVLDQEVCNYDDVEVIGNIYENPELLE